ncbi:MAG: type II toxin-antitoxin system RelE/ParE family toxin, partial [Verrucomicrobiae bacterium]|nr:type II toxin-antitoxin system RelE/ParE family toxin [Verrucomicrobiae bacterium]
IEYQPALAAELEEIRDYYNERSAGLGAAFVNEFERHALAIAARPERWMIVEKDIRRALMKRFPYVIYFRVVDAKSVRITVVKHEKRHPAFGRDRA